MKEFTFYSNSIISWALDSNQHVLYFFSHMRHKVWAIKVWDQKTAMFWQLGRDFSLGVVGKILHIIHQIKMNLHHRIMDKDLISHGPLEFQTNWPTKLKKTHRQCGNILISIFRYLMRKCVRREKPGGKLENIHGQWWRWGNPLPAIYRGTTNCVGSFDFQPIHSAIAIFSQAPLEQLMIREVVKKKRSFYGQADCKGWPPLLPPYGQPDRKNTFFLITSLKTLLWKKVQMWTK